MGALGVVFGVAFRRRSGEAEDMERVMGIEPTSSAWEAEVLPLNYTRVLRARSTASVRTGARRVAPEETHRHVMILMTTPSMVNRVFQRSLDRWSLPIPSFERRAGLDSFERPRRGLAFRPASTVFDAPSAKALGQDLDPRPGRVMMHP